MADPISELGVLLAQALEGSNRIVGIDTLAAGLLGKKDAKGQLVMSDLEMRHPLEFFLLNKAVAAFRARVLPSLKGKLNERRGTTTSKHGTPK